MTTNNTIETLQTQVDQVKIDLDILKEETSESLKKSKAEAAADKLKSTKEEISKKIEALKGLTDANSKADIIKLESMLKTLESSDNQLETLKIAVIEPIDMSKKKETIDNTEDITAITTGISTMKTMTTELQTILNEYAINKNKLSPSEKIAKEKEIQDKKWEIEKKRAEIQSHIDKIKKIRADLKLDDITDETIKNLLKTQKETEEKNIADYQRQLDSIKNPAATFFEKIKDGADKTRQRAKENPKTAIAATAGIWLLVRWISRLFRKKKKNGEEKESKKEEKSRWKKTLLWAGIWTGGILVWKNWDKIKGWFSGLFGWWEKPKEWDGKTDDVESSAKEFKETLSSEEKTHYNSFADNVNKFYAWWNGQMNWDLQNDQLWNSKFETYKWEKIQGLVPFMLNNRYENIDSLLSEWTFYKEVIGTETESMIQKIQWRTADQIGAFLTPIASTIDGMLPALLNLKTTGKVADFVLWLKWNANAQEVISMTFRKTIMVISYLNSKENSLKYKLASDYLIKQDAGFKNKSLEDQNEDITDQLQDEEFCKKNIDPTISKFRDGTLYDGIKLLESFWCADDKLDALTQEAVDDVSERKRDLLDKDDEGNNKIDDIKENFEDGKLNKEGQEDTADLLDEFEDEIDDDWSKTWYNKYVPLMNFFDPSDDIMQKIMNTWEYDKMVKVYKDKIVGIREKSKNGTLTPNDIDDLKKTIDDYYAFEKSLVTSQANIEEVFDKNGNKIIRRWNVIWQSGQALWSGGEMLIDGKYIKWGLITAWALVSLDITTYPVRLALWLFRWKIASSPSTKAVFNIWKFTLRQWANLTWKSLNLALRNYMPAKLSAMMYKGKDYVFRYELAKGNISLDKAVKIAKKNGIQSRISGNIIATEDELIERVAGIWNSSDELKKVNLIKKYWNNKNILKQVIISEYKGNRYAMAWRANKYNYSVNPSMLDELWKIDEFLGRSTHAGKSSLLKWFLETTKSLKPEMIQELFATQTFDALSVEASTDIGRLLGKKMNAFTSLDDFKEFQAFFARNYSRYPSKSFISNTLSKWWKLKTLDDLAQSKYIETANLNLSRYERVASKVKSGITNMIKNLNEMLKNPKMKFFYSGIQSKINNLTAYNRTVTPEGVRAMNDAGWLDTMTWFGRLSDEWIRALQSLSIAIKNDKTIVEALSKATTLDDVGNVKWIKSILKDAWIAVDKIDDGVLMKIVQTKNSNKIESIINYGAEYAGIKTLKAVLKNPAMKAFGKWLWIAWVAIDFAFVGIDFVSDTKEAADIKQYNLARWENKESEAYFDVVVWWTWALAWALWMVALFGASNARNPVWRVCLAWAWTAMWIEALGDLYYGEIDKFKQNYKDFLAQSMPEIKQRLIYINSWQTGLDSSFQDLWSKVTGNMGEEEKKKLSPKTSADAVKSLIYLEELQKYPYAAADLNDAEVRNNPNLKALVEQQKNLHDTAVEARYLYIKKTYIDGKSSIVSKDAIEKNQWIASLDTILTESRRCQTIDNDPNYANKNDVKWYPKYVEFNLKQSNPEGFTKLEKMYAENKVHFFQIVASLWYYESMLNSTDTEDKEKLIANLAFFKNYVNYKLMDVAVSEYPTVILEKDKIDYDEISNLLSAWTLTATTLTAAETSSPTVEYLTDAQINEKYNVSSNLWQNVLYEIANKNLGYIGKNNLADLKIHFREDKKTSNGIYFDPDDQDWAINENNWSDNEFATDAELNDKEKIIQMRWYIADAADSSTTGDMIPWNDTANKEYAKYYVDIINQNLDCRINPKKYQVQIVEYIKANSNGKYIQLPPDLLILWIKSDTPNVGAFVYARDGNKFDAKTTIPWIECKLIIE